MPQACIDMDSALRVGSLHKIVSHDLMLPASIKRGIKLTVKNLRKVCFSIGVELPEKGNGHGETGGVVKLDYCISLVNHFFKDEVEGERKRMVSELMYGKQKAVDLSVLGAVAALDEENAQDFEKMRKHAIMQFEAQVYGRGKSDGQNEAEENHREINESKMKEKLEGQEARQRAHREQENERMWGLTPNDLKELLPGGGAINCVFWAQCHPYNEFFRIDYPTGAMSVYSRYL